MRGIGWLNILRPTAEVPIAELLNDLRFLKYATNAGIATRVMADSDLCELYNYRFDECGAVGAPGADTLVNAIWQMDATGASPSDQFQVWDGSGGPFSALVNFGSSSATLEAVLQTYYADVGVTVTGGPDVYTVEFGGSYSGVVVGGYIGQPIAAGGAVDPFPAFALGTWGGAVAPVFTLIQAGLTIPGAPGSPAAFVPIDWGASPPWTAPSDQSDEFLGFWVENWEGLEGEYDRTTNARGWAFGGSNFTPLRAKHLAMTFEVILGATTERGLQYGFRWLSNMLYGLDQCDRSELVVFDNCPPAGTAQANWPYWLIRDAGVLDMPRWGDILLDTKNCVLRRVTFVLGARDPHKYKCPEICTELTEFIVPAPATACAPSYSWSEWFCNDTLDPICCLFDRPSFDFTSRSTIVHLVAGGGGAPPTEITFEDDGTPLATFRTLPLPAGSELVIDSSRHELRFYATSGGADFIDGSGYVSASFGSSPAWAELGPLGDIVDPSVCVRPLRICGLTGASVWIETVDRV